MTDAMIPDARRIVLARRPEGAARPEDFRLETAALPAPSEGEVLVRVLWMSLDPYMRGRMDDGPSYADPVGLGEVMTAGGVGEVIASRAEGIAEGDLVLGLTGWADHALLRPGQFRKLPEGVEPSQALGVLGMPGFTAWAGLTAYGRMKPGETLVVAAATGPVGSMVGQLAKRAGLRTVAVVGGAEKCRLATETFGFDAAVDHRGKDAEAMRAALAEAAPDGIDVYFENVGGPVLGGVLPLMNLHGRIIVCGMIAWYEGAEDPTAGLPLAQIWRQTLVKRLTIQGLLQGDHAERMPEFYADLAPAVARGEIAFLEDVVEGLENAPEAFLKLLKGGNTGKLVVKVA